MAALISYKQLKSFSSFRWPLFGIEENLELLIIQIAFSYIGRIVQERTMPHVLNFGMGVESSALLVHWMLCTDEERGFPLDNLVVLTAQTGNEYGSTKRLIEYHLFPLIREKKVRFVEIAKAGPSKKDGYVVLQDTRSPQVLHIEGAYKLSDELLKNGTLQPFSGAHKCAQKMKGCDVIDPWLGDVMGFEIFGPYLGYNADETKRAKKCDGYSSRGWTYRFPLIEMGWTREWCKYFLFFHFEVIWLKSCCKFCPFQSKRNAIERWSTEQGAAAFSALMEHLALAFNPRMHMFSYGSAVDLIKELGLRLAYEEHRQTLESGQYGLYRIRRNYERPWSQKGTRFYRIERCVNTVATGTKLDMLEHLDAIACEHALEIETDDYGISRVWSHTRPNDKAYPSCEGFWVVAPALAQDKVRNAKLFEARWALISTLDAIEWGDMLSVEEYEAAHAPA